MTNGKITKFLQEHGFHIICVLGLFIGIAYGIYSCKNAVDIDFDARRNSITTTIYKNKN